VHNYNIPIASKKKESIAIHYNQGDNDFVLKETMDIIENSEPDVEYQTYHEESKIIPVSNL
jgi:hypothetical protein